MDASSKLLLMAVVPVAALVAAGTALVVGRAPSGTRRADGGALLDRVEELERGIEERESPSTRGNGPLLRRIAEVESRLAAIEASTAPAVDGTGAAPVDSGLTAEHRKLREEVVVGLMSETTSADHGRAVERLAAHLVASTGPPLDEAEFTWAFRRLDHEARRGRITPKEAEALEAVLLGLPSGHAARPALAKAVATGWGRDERLGGFLARFGTNSEPAIHQGILRVLDDEHPSAAFSEYVIRIAREERDPSVLRFAFDLDIVEAAATAAVAQRLVQTIEVRVLEGTLDADTRVRAGLAIAVASLRDPETGVKTLGRLAAEETDPDIAESYRRAASQLQQGNATLKSLERLFD